MKNADNRQEKHKGKSLLRALLTINTHIFISNYPTRKNFRRYS